MGHEITKTDNVLLVKERAWHGLGLVVPDAVTPTQALDLIKAEWGVRQVPVYCELPDGGRIQVPGRVANVREDTGEYLGLVAEGHYVVFSNREVAEFCEQLLEVSDTGETRVKVETVGTIMGGKKLWFLLRGEEFAIRDRDEVVPYVCVSNGHDGKTSLKVTPTTVRVVCKNTLSMVVPMDEANMGVDRAAISILHAGDLQGKVEEARKALSEYDFALQMTRTRMEQLGKVEVSKEKLAQFFVELYNQDFRPVEAEPESKKMVRRLEKCKEAMRAFQNHFDRDEDRAGATWWNAFNSYSEYVQHDTKGKGKDDMGRVERRMNSNLFGLGANRTLRAFATALEMASVG